MISRNVYTGAGLALILLFSGCKSAQEKANDQAIAQARQQAATTGTAQQVVSTDKDGSTTTTVVQPQAAGQTTQQVTTTRTTSTTANTLAPAVAAVQTTEPAQSPLQPPNTGVAVAPDTPARTPSGGGPVITPVSIRVARGTTLAIRINQHISVKTSRAGDRFTGEVVNPVAGEGSDRIAIPKGTEVSGVIASAHRRGHFKGRSLLGLRLIAMELNGQRYSLDTRDNVRTKKGKGKRSAAFIGGGSGLGMLVGGLATGGVGLVVGGLVGAGAGTGVAGLTGNRDLEIPAESIINFRLADDLVVRPE